VIAGQNYRAGAWDIFKAANPGTEKYSQQRAKHKGFQNEVRHWAPLSKPSNCAIATIEQ
jgi:hypothetical protein